MSGKAWLSGLVLAFFLWGMILAPFFVCCRGSAPPASPLRAKEVTMAQALAPKLWPAIRSLAVDDDPANGTIRRLFPRTPCETKDPLPYVIPSDRAPRVGEPWECLFVTSACSTPPEPDAFAWIVISSRPPEAVLPLPLEPIGLPGCKLLVNLDQLVSVPPGTESDMLSRVPGRGQIRLRWTPAPGMGGAQVWMQLLVHAPGSAPGGFLMSYAIELTVGA